MKCEMVQQELIAYHFRTASDSVSIEVESHFLQCQACLRSYFELKRTLENPPSESMPSRACRIRIRDDVMRKFRPSLLDRLVAGLRTPIPLYQGMAAFAAIAIAVGIGANLRIPPGSGSAPDPIGRTPGMQMDSSQDHAGSGNIS